MGSQVKGLSYAPACWTVPPSGRWDDGCWVAGFLCFFFCSAVWVGTHVCSQNRPPSGLEKSGEEGGELSFKWIHTWSRTTVEVKMVCKTTQVDVVLF